jgi:hypothetical protein
MASSHPVDELSAVSRSFGRSVARTKLRLLGDLESAPRLSRRRLLRLHDTLLFMRAYPDDEAVRAAVESHVAALRARVGGLTGGDPYDEALVNTGLPATSNAYSYSYDVLQRLVELFPGCVDIDWREFSNEILLVDTLNLAVASAETRGLEDEFTAVRQWLQIARSDADETDLEVVLRLLRRSSLSRRAQMHVYETCEIPVFYRLAQPESARCEVTLPAGPTAYQRAPVRRARFPLPPRITAPLGRHRRPDATAARDLLDRSLAALCSRNLEIHPLIYANAEDVTIVDADRGLRILVAGVLPEFRNAFEADLFFLIAKNGVPIAYGPAVVFAGCCEMGINLFPEFRGGEIRFIYAQFMRVLYHLAGVRYFFLTSYGMGDGNPEAIATGAFWFYRKLGFKAANPEVEALARAEVRVMRRRPGYRSSRKTLRELSYTDAYLDLSRGACRPTDFEALGAAVTADIAGRFGGDRARATASCERETVEALGISNYPEWSRMERGPLRQWAPALSLVPGLSRWPAQDRRALSRLLRGRAIGHELDYARATASLSRLPAAFRSVTESGRR